MVFDKKKMTVLYEILVNLGLNIADEEYDQVSHIQLNCNYCLILKDLF